MRLAHRTVRTAASLALVLGAAAACTGLSSTATEQPIPSVGSSPISSTTAARSPNAAESLSTKPTEGLYIPPDTIPIRSPGLILRTEALDAPDGVRGWAVLYQSTGIDGRPVAVSGVVLAPEVAAPSGGRPILAWGHGSRGLSDDCAPSHEGTVDLMPVAQKFLDMGYVVAATDYEGLGTPGPHPFLVGPSEGRAVLDIVRAAHLLPGTDASRDVALLGHSQGGHAVLWASELAPTYAHELHVVGTTAIAPAGELISLVKSLRGPGGTEIKWLIGLQIASAWHEVYGLTLDDVLSEGDQERAAALPATCPDFGLIPPEQPLVHDITTLPGWREQLEGNTPGATRAIAPILIVHGTADEVIPVDTTRAEVQRLCQVGDTVVFQVIEGADHGDPLWGNGRLDALARWTRERFDDTPVANSCLPT